MTNDYPTNLYPTSLSPTSLSPTDELDDRDEAARQDESVELATGDGAGAGATVPPAVDKVVQAQQRLASLEGQPVTAHIETYEGVHVVLRDALAELDEA